MPWTASNDCGLSGLTRLIGLAGVSGSIGLTRLNGLTVD